MKLSATRAQVALPPPAAQARWRELTQRSIDLHLWYWQAIRHCEPGLRMVLEDNARMLAKLIDELQAQHGAGGNFLLGHASWRSAATRQAFSWLMHALGRPERSWLRLLAHQGADLLESFEDSIARLPAAQARVLCRQLPRLRGICQDMHCLVGSAS